MPAIEGSNGFEYVWVEGPGAAYSDDPGRWVPSWEEPAAVAEMVDAMLEADLAEE